MKRIGCWVDSCWLANQVPWGSIEQGLLFNEGRFLPHGVSTTTNNRNNNKQPQQQQQQLTTTTTTTTTRTTTTTKQIVTSEWRAQSELRVYLQLGKTCCGGGDNKTWMLCLLHTTNKNTQTHKTRKSQKNRNNWNPCVEPPKAVLLLPVSITNKKTMPQHVVCINTTHPTLHNIAKNCNY
jgi:hypothetical protein